MKLAHILQSHQFSSVMVLDGGFPALISQLIQSRGALEPVIINHDHEKWSNYLIITGRHQSLKTDLQVSKEFVQSLPLEVSRGHSGQNSSNPKKLNTELEQVLIALDVATRLGHVHMRKILEERVERLQRS